MEVSFLSGFRHGGECFLNEPSGVPFNVRWLRSFIWDLGVQPRGIMHCLYLCFPLSQQSSSIHCPAVHLYQVALVPAPVAQLIFFDLVFMCDCYIHV